MFDPRSCSPTGPAFPRPWAGNSNFTKAEAQFGMPLSGLGADLAIAGGKRHFAQAAPGVATPRNKSELLSGHGGGQPLWGNGADITLAGGKRLFPTTATHEFGPVGAPNGSASPRRSKIEALNGMPMQGQYADITLAGGKKHYSAAERAESAPPQIGLRNETFRDEHLLRTRGLIGRDLRSSPRKTNPTERVRLSRSERRRAVSPGSPQGNVCVARRKSPVATPRMGRVTRKVVPAKLDATNLDLLASSQHLKVPLDQQSAASTIAAGSAIDEGASETCATSVGAASTASLCALVQSTSVARTLQEVVDCTPKEAPYKSELEDMLRDKMEVAWAILSKELDLDNKKGGRRKGRVSAVQSFSDSTPCSPVQTQPRQTAVKSPSVSSKQGTATTHMRCRSDDSLHSYIIAGDRGSKEDLRGEPSWGISADGMAGNSYMSSVSTSSVVIPESTIWSCGSVPEHLRRPRVQKASQSPHS